MTEREFSIYLSVAAHDYRVNRSYRMGQAYFNTLADLHPAIAEEYRATPWDPFYNDQLVPKFLNHLYNQFVRSDQNA